MLISARNLSFAYAPRAWSPPGRPVVRDVSLDVASGARLGIIGPNGSGKTTLLKLLAGVLTPTSGSVALDGVALSQISRRAVARRIAMVPQNTHPAFDYTVLELALMGRYPHLGALRGRKPGRPRHRARGAGRDGHRRRLRRGCSRRLSGGEQQRVVIASALAQQAELLLLDEPTASLDPGYQLEIAELLRALHRQRGIGLVLSTHDLNLAASVCDTLVLLRDGEVVAAGATAEVLTPRGHRVAVRHRRRRAVSRRRRTSRGGAGAQGSSMTSSPAGAGFNRPGSNPPSAVPTATDPPHS